MKVKSLLMIMLAIVGVFFVGKLILVRSHPEQTIAASNVVDCQMPLIAHQIIITHDGFDPKTIQAKVCDMVVFVNKDTMGHQPAFGKHPVHLLYPGYTEQFLAPGESSTAILTAFGNYTFHDHMKEESEGTISISR